MKVFTNGCFDILHVQHIMLLDFCRQLADTEKNGKVIVGLNSDSSIRRIKGPKRPIINQLDRLQILNALKSVDEVCFFYEDTPEELIRHIQPDIIVKGHDWKGKKVVGSDKAKVIIINTDESITTTKIIEKCYNSFKESK